MAGGLLVDATDHVDIVDGCGHKEVGVVDI